MDTTPFDLNQALSRWRGDLASAPALHAGTLDELEGHLRDSTATLVGSGLTEEEAFLVASRRLGPSPALAAEFDKVQPGAVWRVRCGWMLAGIALWLFTQDVSFIAAIAAIYAGHLAGTDGFAAGWLGVIARVLLVGAAATAFLAMMRGRIWRSGEGPGCLRASRTAPLVIALLAVLLTARIAATLAPALLVRQMSPAYLGQALLMGAWSQGFGTLQLLAAIAVGLTWSLRGAALRRTGLAAVLAGALLCPGPTSPPAEAREPGPFAAATQPGATTLDQTLKLWNAGKKDEALKAFLAIDFSRKPLFPPGAVLGYTEKQFIELPKAVRDKIHPEIVAGMKPLKALSSHVRDTARAAAAAGQTGQARTQVAQLKRFGEALDQPDALALLKLVGKAIQKMAATP